jgi:hypothetical protein
MLLGSRQCDNSVILKASGSLNIGRQLILIGSIAAVAAVALFMTILPFSRDLPSITEIPFFFFNGQEITVKGMFVDCVPTKSVDICIAGFRSNDGAYFVLIDHGVDDLRQLTNQGHFQVAGRFSTNMPEQYWATDVTGVISVSSITPIDSI